MRPKIEILSPKEIREQLKSFPGWTYKNNKISKEFTLASFNSVVKLIDELAPYCNRIDHHPDIHINYKKVLFELQRFDIGGKVTTRDFLVAKKIEELYKKMRGK
jgi:4a-hydroxytetrahydrobiopterin dehydratase